MTRLSLFCLGIVLLAGCATASAPDHHTEATTGNSSPSGSNTVLRHHDAIRRAKQVADVSYNLWFGLDALNDDFEGRAVIQFVFRESGRKLGKYVLVDFEDASIKAIRLNNNTQVDPKEYYDGHQLFIRTSELLSGANRLEIRFSRKYTRHGDGFNRFKDPADGHVYLYTNFGSYSAHKMFPCFDQPDLKATYEVTVEAPEDWQVVSNTLERDVTKVDGRRSWAFPPSPVFSPYVFAIHAGPFASWKSEAGGIPIRLFMRKSLASQPDSQPKDWFDVTRAGLDFYSVEFGYPYPYSKYDQILVPEPDSTGIADVAAVALSEQLIPPSRARAGITAEMRRQWAGTLLHEMAHMWFGDLVTMRWWNGLWLNESFATLMSYRAMDGIASDLKNRDLGRALSSAWQVFSAEIKASAYKQDQLPTTHPIEVSVPDTTQVQANHEGIAHAKGAAVLRQLSYFLGEDDFREGIQRYFQKYAQKSTSLAHFFQMLAEASARNLQIWQKSWLQSQGVNSVQAQWACDGDGKISSFSLNQGLGNSPALRPHKAELALYSFQPKKGQLMLRETIGVEYSKAETPVPALVGKRCPDFVFPNHEDRDYVKVILDEKSLETAKKQSTRFGSPLMRDLVGNILREMQAVSPSAGAGQGNDPTPKPASDAPPVSDGPAAPR